MRRVAKALNEIPFVNETLALVAEAGDAGLVARHNREDLRRPNGGPIHVGGVEIEDLDRDTLAVLDFLLDKGLVRSSFERRYLPGVTEKAERFFLTDLGRRLIELDKLSSVKVA